MKKVGGNFAWIATTSPEQLHKLHSLKIPVMDELLQPSRATGEILTEEEVAKRNCLVLIAKNLNLIKSMKDTEIALKTHFGTKNINVVYFPRARGTTHSGVANIECPSPVVYMQYVKKTTKILGKYMTLQPHPKSMTGSLKPNKETLERYGSLDVNVALAGTVEVLQNALVACKPSQVDITETVAREVQKFKGELTSEMQTMRQEIVEEARDYTDKITKELKSTMSIVEIALSSSMKALQKMKKLAITNSGSPYNLELN